MKEDELIKVRSKLGMYLFRSGGYCQLGEKIDGTFFISIHESGKSLKRFKCEPKYIIQQAVYFDAQASQIKEFRAKHPELRQFFTKSGQPRTDATVLIEILEEMPVSKPKSFGLENLFQNFNS
jgi:hypothetical protein